MAGVLHFELRSRPARARPVPDAGAEIIIFPGVRFERLDVQVEQPVPPTSNTTGDRALKRRLQK